MIYRSLLKTQCDYIEFAMSNLYDGCNDSKGQGQKWFQSFQKTAAHAHSCLCRSAAPKHCSCSTRAHLGADAAFLCRWSPCPCHHGHHAIERMMPTVKIPMVVVVVEVGAVTGLPCRTPPLSPTPSLPSSTTHSNPTSTHPLVLLSQKLISHPLLHRPCRGRMSLQPHTQP